MVFLECSDVDFRVLKECVDQTAEVMRKMSGNVTERLYPNIDHTINQDEMDFVYRIIDIVLPPENLVQLCPSLPSRRNGELPL